MAYVDYKVQSVFAVAVFFYIYNAYVEGEMAALFVAKFYVCAAAVVVGEFIFEEAVISAQRVAEDVEHVPKRVVALPRGGSVRRFAVRRNISLAVFYFYLRVFVLRGYFAVYHAAAFCHDHVASASALNVFKTFGYVKIYVVSDKPLFAVYHGKVAVGRETFCRHNVHLVVFFYALPAALFVAAEDKAYLTVGFISLLQQLIHGIKTAHHRTFVVEYSSAEDVSVFYFA